MNNDEIKGFIQVLIDAECLSSTIDDTTLEGFELGYLYATNPDFKLFFNECVEIHNRFIEYIREDNNVGSAQNFLGFYYTEISQANIPDRYNYFIRLLCNA